MQVMCPKQLVSQNEHKIGGYCGLSLIKKEMVSAWLPDMCIKRDKVQQVSILGMSLMWLGQSLELELTSGCQIPVHEVLIGTRIN